MRPTITVGRRPRRGYKDRMRLGKAYSLMEWTPVEFEREHLEESRQRGLASPRQLGTSVHMLMELYLDMADSLRQRGVSRPAAPFLVVCLHDQQARYLRDHLRDIHGRLALDVDPDKATFWPVGRLRKKPNSVRRMDPWYSWAVFCDHAVKDADKTRNLWPYRLIRKVRRVGGYGKEGWVGTDREDRVIARLTDKGMSDLADAATCPLTIMRNGNPTTYPAYTECEELNQALRLREAFRG